MKVFSELKPVDQIKPSAILDTHFPQVCFFVVNTVPMVPIFPLQYDLVFIGGTV